MSSFHELSLTPSVLKSLERMNYEKPTDVQARTIPLVIEGRDVLVTAQTGTGKTAAFAVPILQSMIAALEADQPVRRALVLAPTRELAEQIGTVLRELTFFYRRLRYAVVIGGAPYGKQFRELGQNPAFVIGTPGRLIDHMETGSLKLDDFEFLVLDESDRMLDMGFAPQIEMIVKRFPEPRQTMMFSATLPQEVRGLVARYLKNPARVAIGEENRPVARIQQDVIELREGDKEETLLREIDKVAGSIIVFTKTRLRADLVASMLSEAGHRAAALHGEMNQGARRRVTAQFRDGEIRILVATDIAARGLDIDHVRHVFNYDLPMVPEDYVHRIGRTGRNGAEGHSVAFVMPTERQRWGAILRLMGQGGSAGRADGRGGGGVRGYKNAASRGAFSDRGMNPDRDRNKAGGSSRRDPFTQAYLGPNEKDASSFSKKTHANVRHVKPARANALGARDKKWAPKPVDPMAEKIAELSGEKPLAKKRKGISQESYHSPEAQKVRAIYQQRVERAEIQKARKLGRTPRFTSESNANPRLNSNTGASITPSMKKPHKGAPDTRKRKSSVHAKTSKTLNTSENAHGSVGKAPHARPVAGARDGGRGGNHPPRRRR